MSTTSHQPLHPSTERPITAANTDRSAGSSEVVLIEASPSWKLIDWKECWRYRDLLYFLVLRDFTVLYKQTVLGVSWAVLNPLFNMVVLTVIFGRVLRMDSDGMPYALFSLTALLPWTYFSQALTVSTNSLVAGTGIFTKVYFPRLFIPLAPVFSKLADMGIAFVILLIAMACYGVMPPWRCLLLPIPLFLLVLTTAGLGVGLSALAIRYRDVRHAMAFAIQILMYAAPVVWPASKIQGSYRILYGLYPMAGVIEGFRAALLGTTPMPWDLLVPGLISGSLITIASGLYFRRTERYFADVA